MAILGIKEREKTFLQDAPISLSSLFIDAVNGVVAACVPIPLATHKDWGLRWRTQSQPSGVRADPRSVITSQVAKKEVLMHSRFWRWAPLGRESVAPQNRVLSHSQHLCEVVLHRLNSAYLQVQDANAETDCVSNSISGLICHGRSEGCIFSYKSGWGTAEWKWICSSRKPGRPTVPSGSPSHLQLHQGWIPWCRCGRGCCTPSPWSLCSREFQQWFVRTVFEPSVSPGRLHWEIPTRKDLLSQIQGLINHSRPEIWKLWVWPLRGTCS